MARRGGGRHTLCITEAMAARAIVSRVLSRAACAGTLRGWVGSSTSATPALPALAAPYAMRTFAVDPFEGSTDLEPPVKQYGTAAKYAQALWSAATKADVLDTVAADVAKVIELKGADASFSAFLDDPTIEVEKKVAGLKEVCQTGKLNDITRNFLFVMAENGRLNELATVAEQYQELVYASRGEVLVTVTSAIPLSAAQENECKKVLTEKVLKKGEKLVLDVKIDRKILGGLIFDIGEKHIDMSIEARIRKIENLLREAVGSA